MSERASERASERVRVRRGMFVGLILVRKCELVRVR